MQSTDKPIAAAGYHDSKATGIAMVLVEGKQLIMCVVAKQCSRLAHPVFVMATT